MSVIHDVEQNSDEWFQCRLGIPTASEVATILAGGKGRKTYMMNLAAERITGKMKNSFAGNAHTRRGHEDEKTALEIYALSSGDELWDAGFVTTNDGRVGASPDSMINADGLAECKSKNPEFFIPVLLSQQVPTQHEPQIMTQLYVAECDWAMFICYCEGFTPVTIRVDRDEKRIKQIADALDKFNDELDELEQQIRGKL